MAPPRVHGYVHIERKLDERNPLIQKVKATMTDSAWAFDVVNRQDYEFMVQHILGAKCPKDAFFIGAHGTPTRILSSSIGETRLNNPNPTGAVIGKMLQSDSTYAGALRDCKYVIVIACNAGNVEAAAKKNALCFAKELSNTINKPCYAPQGYLETRSDGQGKSKVWSKFDWTAEKGSGELLDWQMFTPDGWKGVVPPNPDI